MLTWNVKWNDSTLLSFSSFHLTLRNIALGTPFYCSLISFFTLFFSVFSAVRIRHSHELSPFRWNPIQIVAVGRGDVTEKRKIGFCVRFVAFLLIGSGQLDDRDTQRWTPRNLNSGLLHLWFSCSIARNFWWNWESETRLFFFLQMQRRKFIRESIHVICHNKT